MPHEDLLAHLARSSTLSAPRGVTMHKYRTHHCNELRASDIGSTAKLAGWVHVRRDHGGVVFIDLRDREGLTQVVFRPEENAELTEIAHTLRHEDVIEVEGRVAPRIPGTENPKLATGDIELLPQQLRILNRADVLPFPLDSDPSNEDLRLSAIATSICAARSSRAICGCAIASRRRRAITSTSRASSKSRRRFFRRARRKARAISSSRAVSRRASSTRCRRRRSNTSSC